MDCYGFGSCAGSMINNIGDGSTGQTGCYGTRSCQSVSLLKGTVQFAAGLRGYLSLAWTKIAAVSELGCYGEASCYKIGNTTSYTVSCWGLRSCAELKGTNNNDVYGYGALSLENSIIILE